MNKLRKEDSFKVAVQCNLCSNVIELEVNLEDYQKWQGGELIQNAMPYLTPGERELLISGICNDCFERMFG